jgi:hypothetical protein
VVKPRITLGGMKDQSTICFRCTTTERKALNMLAALNHRTVSDQIRAMIAAAAKAQLGAMRERNK